MTDIMKKTLGILMTTGLLLSLCGCDLSNPFKNNNNSSGKERVAPIVLTTEEEAVSDAGRDFAFRFMKAVDATMPGGNYVVSPYSAQVALSMALNGAAGSTFNQMRDVLGFGGMDIEDINSYNKKVIEGLNYVEPDGDVKVANSLWINKRFPFEVLGQYEYTIADSYFAKVGTVDFSSSGAVKSINRWCSSNTNSLINNVVDNLNPSSVAMLLNALYFKAPWHREFDKKDNFKGDFLANGVSKQNVEYMVDGFNSPYYKNEKFEVVSKAFCKTNQFQFFIVLPAVGVTPEECLDDLPTVMRESSSRAHVTLSIPKFSVKKNCDLKPALVSMGMSEPFGEDADFSNLVSQLSEAPLVITDVNQGNTFLINEKGTEGASVTKVEIGYTSPGLDEVDLFVNRPFLFFVQESGSGAILYAGKVSSIE